MRITYKTHKLRKLCTDRNYGIKHCGRKMTDVIHVRIKEISASSNLDEMELYHIGGCHKLIGNLKGHYSFVLVHPYRLVVKPLSVDMDIIEVVNFVDYH